MRSSRAAGQLHKLGAGMAIHAHVTLAFVTRRLIRSEREYVAYGVRGAGHRVLVGDHRALFDDIVQS